MSRVRRINVSQIEGNDANDNDNSEIRPFGEIGIYADETGDRDKPVLVMFDGQRTHIKSKVLQPGILFGSNADSGDGQNLDTIKLIPDAVLYRDGSDQYLVVDPTDGEPGHIHLRAGGTQDASTADLYLGGELTNVRVSDTSDNVRIRTSVVSEGITNYDWTFDNSGDLTFPGSSNARIGESEPGLVVRSDAGFAVVTNANSVSDYEIEFVGYISDGFANNPGATLTVTEIIVGTITNGMTVYGAGLPPEGWTVTVGTLPNAGSGGVGNYELSGANILTSVQSFNNGVAALGSQSWLFDSGGGITLPNGGTITESVVTDNPTVVITPATPDVASQSLIIKGGVPIEQDYHLHLTTGDLTETSVILGTDEHNVRTTHDQGVGGVEITARSYFNETSTVWRFFPQLTGEGTVPAKIIFPDNTEQRTAWAGGRVVSAPNSSVGDVGNTAGDLAFTNDHIYYCTADFTPNRFVTTVAFPGVSIDTIPVVKGNYVTPTTSWTVVFSGVEYFVTNVADGGDSWILTVAGQGQNSTGGTGIEVTLYNGVPSPNIWKRIAWSADTW